MRLAHRGSALLLCLALSAMAVMIGYAFLRTLSRQDLTGHSQHLVALAQSAARSGATHAMENILRDYNAASVDVARGTGTVTVSPAPTHLDGLYRAQFVSWRHPNTSRIGPDSAFDSDDVSEENTLTATLMPWQSVGDPTDYHEWDGLADRQGGFIVYDGRGRWIEVNYHNVDRPSPTALIDGPHVGGTITGVPQPVVPTRFTDRSAPTPTRQDGVFLDHNLARLPAESGTTPADQRRAARYRLRYAVGVEDLMGHLLINPRADMDCDWTNPSNDYRVVPDWVEQGGHMLDATTANWKTVGSERVLRTMGLRLGHIFRGRGNSENADRKDSGTRAGLPATFPMMFRQTQIAGTIDHPWYGNHDYSTKAHDNLGGRLFGFDNTLTTTTDDYPSIRATAAGGEILTPVGGTDTHSKNAVRPYVHALTGPQQSWYNLLFSLAGCHPGTDTNLQNTDGYWWNSDGRSHNYAYDWAGKEARHNLNYALHGRSQQAAPGVTALARRWYQGEVNTAWQVNLLTATTQTLSSMILTYVPPYAKVVHYEKERWFRRTTILLDTPQVGLTTDVYDTNDTPDFETDNDATDSVKTWTNGSPTLPRTTSPDQAPWDLRPWAIDPFTDLLGPGFSEFPAPSSTDALGQTVRPDFYQSIPAGYPKNPPEFRFFNQCYPGPAVRADPQTVPPEASPAYDVATYGFGFENLGDLINVDRGLDLDQNQTPIVISGSTTGTVDPRGWCATTKNPIHYFGGVNETRYVTLTPNPPWASPGNKFKVIRYVSATFSQASASSSYFWDLTAALTTTISYARATWDQYPTHDSPTKSHFNPHLASGVSRGWESFTLRDPTNCDSIEDIDRLFLRNLGENFDSPGFPAAQNPLLVVRYQQNTHSFWVSPVPVSHTIASLVAGDLIKVDVAAAPGSPVAISSAERGKVMERILNDYRMSFFGASPRYSLGVDDSGNPDSSREFRPLDFDGDGKVVASAYPRNGSATALEVAYCTDRWMAVDATHAKPGRGPRPTNWFSATGCFFIGKSHYYRIFVRGEVYDNLLKKPVAQQDLETVYCVDPEAPLFPAANRVSPEQRVLFQQWRQNVIASELPAQRR